MMRLRKSLAVAVAIVCFVTGSFAADRPNVIIIYTDDHGVTDLGLHGIDPNVNTPTLDQ